VATGSAPRWCRRVPPSADAAGAAIAAAPPAAPAAPVGRHARGQRDCAQRADAPRARRRARRDVRRLAGRVVPVVPVGPCRRPAPGRVCGPPGLDSLCIVRTIHGVRPTSTPLPATHLAGSGASARPSDVRDGPNAIRGEGPSAPTTTELTPRGDAIPPHAGWHSRRRRVPCEAASGGLGTSPPDPTMISERARCCRARDRSTDRPGPTLDPGPRKRTARPGTARQECRWTRRRMPHGPTR
jgi:hypothetical protein